MNINYITTVIYMRAPYMSHDFYLLNKQLWLSIGIFRICNKQSCQVRFRKNPEKRFLFSTGILFTLHVARVFVESSRWTQWNNFQTWRKFAIQIFKILNNVMYQVRHITIDWKITANSPFVWNHKKKKNIWIYDLSSHGDIIILSHPRCIVRWRHSVAPQA